MSARLSLRFLPHAIAHAQSFFSPAAQNVFPIVFRLRWVDFHARSRFARSTIPEEKWGTTRSLHRIVHLLLGF